jgi:hypothetical protein
MNAEIIALSILGMLSILNLILTAVLFRHLGILIMGTARGVSKSGIAVGRYLPDVDIPLINGRHWNPAKSVERPSLIYFASPECVECRKVTRELVLRTHRSDTFDLVTLVFGDIETAQSYADKHGLGHATGAISGDIAAQLDVEVTPFMYAVTDLGQIASKGLVNSDSQVDNYVQSITSSDGALS